MVDAALGIDLWLVGPGGVGELGAEEDVEVVVGGVAAGVALGADRGAEDDEVLGDAWVFRLLVYLAAAVRKEGGDSRDDILAWIMYIAPMAPPALLKIHSSSRLTWLARAGLPCSSETM